MEQIMILKFSIRTESEKLKDGFNFYPLNDKHSKGFIYRNGSFAQTDRYSKQLKKIVCQKLNII